MKNKPLLGVSNLCRNQDKLFAQLKTFPPGLYSSRETYFVSLPH